MRGLVGLCLPSTARAGEHERIQVVEDADVGSRD